MDILSLLISIAIPVGLGFVGSLLSNAGNSGTHSPAPPLIVSLASADFLLVFPFLSFRAASFPLRAPFKDAMFSSIDSAILPFVLLPFLCVRRSRMPCSPSSIQRFFLSCCFLSSACAVEGCHVLLH
jgi:hypothetical protein